MSDRLYHLQREYGAQDPEWIESKLEGEPVSPEYEAGFVAGIRRDGTNPHPVGTQEHSDWMLGYVDGDMKVWESR